MPEICRFYGIIIRMYSADHPPPHFHANYAEHEAFIEIATGRVIYGFLPNTALRLVHAWLDQHRAEVLQLWDLAISLQPLHKIAPLD